MKRFVLIVPFVISFCSIKSIEHTNEEMRLSKVKSVFKAEKVAKQEIILTPLYELLSQLSDSEKTAVFNYITKVNATITTLLKGFIKNLENTQITTEELKNIPVESEKDNEQAKNQVASTEKKEITSSELNKYFTELLNVIGSLFNDYKKIEISDLNLKKSILKVYIQLILNQITYQILINDKLNQAIVSDLKRNHSVFKKHSLLMEFKRSKL